MIRSARSGQAVSERILGGNWIGRDGEARKINTLAVALYNEMTLEQAFPDQADNPLYAAQAQGTLQSQILPVKFEMTLLICPSPVGEKGGLDVVNDGLPVLID